MFFDSIWQPERYVSHLIGHEGPGSLLSELKNRGWVNSLVAGESSGAKGFAFFGINVDLTEDGIQHTDDIVTLVFQVDQCSHSSGSVHLYFDLYFRRIAVLEYAAGAATTTVGLRRTQRTVYRPIPLQRQRKASILRLQFGF